MHKLAAAGLGAASIGGGALAGFAGAAIASPVQGIGNAIYFVPLAINALRKPEPIVPQEVEVETPKQERTVKTEQPRPSPKTRTLNSSSSNDLPPATFERGNTDVAGKGGVQITKSIIKGFTKHGVNQAIERGFKTSDILKIVREGTQVQAMGRYGAQTRYTLGGNTVVLNALGKIVTVYSTAPGTQNGLGKGYFVPFK